MLEPTTLTMPRTVPPLRRDLLDGSQRVEGLARLADRHVDRVRLDDRIAIAELRGRLGVGGNPRDALDQLGPGHGRRSRPSRSRGSGHAGCAGSPGR